jgi:hypothetical protein
MAKYGDVRMVIVLDISSLKDIPKNEVAYWFFKYIKETAPHVYIPDIRPVDYSVLVENENLFVPIEKRLNTQLLPRLLANVGKTIAYEIKNDFLYIMLGE